MYKLILPRFQVLMLYKKNRSESKTIIDDTIIDVTWVTVVFFSETFTVFCFVVTGVRNCVKRQFDTKSFDDGVEYNESW